MNIEDFSEETRARFWAKVDIRGEDECWPWKASAFNGYGRFHYHPRRPIGKSHRIAFMLSGGTLGNLDCLHSCNNPPCCNPKHLRAGTGADNVLDKMRSGRFRGRFDSKALTEDELEKLSSLIKDRGIDRKTLKNIMGFTTARLVRAIRIVRHRFPEIKPNWRMRNQFSDSQLLEILSEAEQRILHSKIAESRGVKLGSIRNILKRFRKVKRDGVPLFTYWAEPLKVGKPK